MQYKVISADDHIDFQWLPTDVWQKRVAAKWRDRAPKVVETPEGAFWFCDGKKWGVWGTGEAGRISTTSTSTVNWGRRSALERGGVVEPGVLRPTTPHLRLADMDRDGVDASILYGPIVPPPTAEPELKLAYCRAYNEWLIEFCGHAPDRFIGAGMIPIDDPIAAAAELRYLKEYGVRTALFLAERAVPAIWDQAWEPLWEAAAGTGISLAFHPSGVVRTATYTGPQAADPGNMGVRSSCLCLQMDEPLAGLVFSGALARYPSLKIVLAEVGIGWLPYLYERMDDIQDRFVEAREFWAARGGLRLKEPPSFYCRRQIWSTFQRDRVGMRLLDLIGEDRAMWASDYPHGDSTWPDSPRVIREELAGFSNDVQRRLVCDNARALYGL